jgi:hypothetical protein
VAAGYAPIQEDRSHYGRICRRVTPSPRRPHGEPRGLEVGAGGLAPHARRLFHAPERPAQRPKGQHFSFLVVAQDVGHAGERDHGPSRRVNVLSAYPLWPVLRCRPTAGFRCRPRRQGRGDRASRKPAVSRPAFVGRSSQKRRGGHAAGPHEWRRSHPLHPGFAIVTPTIPRPSADARGVMSEARHAENRHAGQRPIPERLSAELSCRLLRSLACSD